MFFYAIVEVGFVRVRNLQWDGCYANGVRVLVSLVGELELQDFVHLTLLEKGDCRTEMFRTIRCARA